MDCSVPAPLPLVFNKYVNNTIPGLGVTSAIDVDSVLAAEVTKHTIPSGGQGNSEFLMGAAPYGPGAGGALVAAGPTGLVAYLTKVGNDWCAFSPFSCPGGTDIPALAQKWADVLVAWLQAAPACAYRAGLTGSLYDNWGKPMDPYGCPPGQSFNYLDGICEAPPCPRGYTRQSSGLPCEPIAASGEQVTAGRTQQTAPTGIVPVQTTPTNYNNGPYITTQGGGTSPVASPATGGNTQTPFVSANLIPASTLTTTMANQTGYSTATPGQWCRLMAAMLGGFNCPPLALAGDTPVTADTFLNALRQAESAQTAAPAITGGGFQTMSGPYTPAPASAINTGVAPTAPGAAATSSIGTVGMVAIGALLAVVVLGMMHRS